jgi:sugar phosphate isomerase/epimerase
MVYSRRDLGKFALASLPLARAFGAPNSKINGVQIGVISYSFRQMPEQSIDDIIRYMTKIGLSEVELMSNHAEADAGAPAEGQGAPRAGAPAAARAKGGRRQITPEMRAAMQARAEELRKWRMSVSMDRFKDVRKKFDTAGIDLQLLCYNMQDSMTDDEIEYGFHIAKALGAKAISTSTTISMSKRIAPLADKHQMMVGYHGHDQTSDPNQFATLESYATAFSYGKYNGVNLDIGHFTASNYDAVAFIKEHHARITNLHLKDRKKNHGPNTPWGQGDTPLKEVLLLLKENRYPFPGNIEYEYQGESDPVTEVGKCYEFCKKILA